MSGIILPSAYLYSERISHVQELLRPLCDGDTIHCQFVPGTSGSSKVISSKSRQAKTPDNYHDWRFPTKAAPRIWFHYYEIWNLIGVGRDCKINRAYFHLYIIDRPSQKFDQIICVHSDPDEQPADPSDEKLTRQCRYKRGPHLHVLTAGELAKCHFPLNLGHLDQVLSSIDDLTKALADAVEVVRNEIVELYINSKM
jgi:hypothetical protein